jgi:hypothetical protein
MPEIRTVTTLVKKRDEIRATIRMCEKKIAQARADLSHVTAVMQLFEASGKTQDLARYAEAEWAERAAAFLKHKLKECEVTYVELANRLKKHGFKDETEASITMRLKRGTFPATWFLAVLAALEQDGVALEEI